MMRSALDAVYLMLGHDVPDETWSNEGFGDWGAFGAFGPNETPYSVAEYLKDCDGFEDDDTLALAEMITDAARLGAVCEPLRGLAWYVRQDSQGFVFGSIGYGAELWHDFKRDRRAFATAE